MKKTLLAVCLIVCAVAAEAAQRMSVRTFLAEHLDTTRPGLEQIPARLAADDLPGAEKIFADYIRRTLPVDKMIPADWQRLDPARRASIATVVGGTPSGWATRPADTNLVKLTAAAKRVMGYELNSCGLAHQFPVGKIDWTINPTYNHYCEWPWQLNRHWDFSTLARYYLATGDEQAPKTYVDMLTSWFDQMTVPPRGEPYYSPHSVGWRTISTGIRLECWFWQFPSMLKSPALTDHFIAQFFTSVWEHCWRLDTSGAGRGNWILLEKRGEMAALLWCPFIKETPRWLAACEKVLAREMPRQFCPDGCQIELTTNYHKVTVDCYLGIYELYRASGHTPPAYLLAGLEKPFEYYVRLKDPFGFTPILNDGARVRVATEVARAHALYPNNPVFTDHPGFLSCAFDNAGAAVFRTGWGKNDIWAYFDGGLFGAGHQHEDKLNFLLTAYGKSMLVEAGSYAYDTSAMRRYVLSTRAHNTVMFDGLEQSRGRSFRYHPENIAKKCDMVFSTTPARDVAEAEYASGYGPKQIRFTHRRRIEFVKDDPKGPAFVVTDSFTAPDDKPHTYQILWHLETSRLACEGQTFTADFGGGVKLLASWDDPRATVENQSGRKAPAFQGWMPIHAPGDHEHRPIPTPVVRGTFTKTARVVTTLRPVRAK